MNAHIRMYAVTVYRHDVGFGLPSERTELVRAYTAEDAVYQAGFRLEPKRAWVTCVAPHDGEPEKL